MFQLMIAALGIILLMFNNTSAVTGATEGISLCLKTVIPSLFPMMVLSVLLTGNASGKSGSLMKVLCKPFGIPDGLESILITGFIGGYPTGAKCISQALNAKQLSKPQARNLLILCNNAGPGFIFGMAHCLFPSIADLWMLWIIHILSALSTGLILPKNKTSQIASIKETKCTLTEAVSSSVRTMATVCSWIVLFKVFLSVINPQLSIMSAEIKCMIYGITELTNGISSLNSIESLSTRFILASGMLSFGGLCIFLQTRSIAGSIFSRYIPGKILQALFSILYAAIWNGIFRQEVNILMISASTGLIAVIIFIIKMKLPIDFVQMLNYNGIKKQA